MKNKKLSFISALFALFFIVSCNNSGGASGGGAITSEPNTVYVSDYHSSVFMCGINHDGSFNACAATPASGAPPWAPNDAKIQEVNGVKYGYVSDENGNAFYCTLNSDGTFNTCSSTPATGAPAWTTVWAISFATVNGTLSAYVVDSDGGHVYQCSLNSDGSFNTCAITPATGAPAWTPTNLVFHTIHGVQYAYLGAINTGHIYQCTLNSDGTFNTCNNAVTSGEPSWSLYGTANFGSFNGQQYAYVGATDGNLYRCTVNNNDGTFSGCAATPSTGAPSGWDPTTLAFPTIGGIRYGYVADGNNLHIYQCTLNSDGTFNTCNNAVTAGEPGWGIWEGLFFAKF